MIIRRFETEIIINFWMINKSTPLNERWIKYEETSETWLQISRCSDKPKDKRPTQKRTEPTFSTDPTGEINWLAGKAFGQGGDTSKPTPPRILADPFSFTEYPHSGLEAGRQQLHRWKSVSWQNAFETTISLLLDRTVVTISRQRSAGDGPMPMWLERVLQVYRRFVDGRSNSYLNFQAGEIRDTNLFEKLNLIQQSRASRAY